MQFMRPLFGISIIRLTVLLLFCCINLSAHAATITIINSDGAGEGFNDTSSFTAVGGNYANTLGQARLNAMQYAANLAAQYISSNIEIKIDAKMNALGGTAYSATLGSAGPVSVARDFGAGTPSTWYPMALAEALTGSNLNGTYDIVATFNSDVDNSTVLGLTNWYYGLDGNAGSHTDFVSVAMHEILHGLGFLSVINGSTGALLSGYTDVYTNNLEHHGATPADFPSMTDGQRLTAITDTSNLHWTGSSVSSNSGVISSGKNGTHVYLYAPGTYESGSSVSHFSTSVSPNEVMEPFYVSPNHSPSLAVSTLSDIGWTTYSGSGSADLHLALDNSGVTSGTNTTYTLTITNNGSNTAVQTTVTYMIPTGHSYTSATAAQGNCTHANQVVSCHLGNLSSGTSTTVSVVAFIGTNETRTHAAVVSSATNEANDSDNRVTDGTVTIPGSGGGGGGCFIATAAWGSPLTREVSSLRVFRDHYLLTNKPGQIFVDLYYQYSPPVANIIRKNETLRAITQGSLGPLLGLSRWLNRQDDAE
ncbi:MAG: DUF11 domain-containing protein [Gammaproteobacteria bacterium]|nr:DUF11 domain-containing protein [Gammaproteobacteria bacterium]MDH5777790.1 DUF11 domain-containing protein [Gammaproteobacteria bacterium]